MKKSLYLFFGILLICGIYQACVPDVELPGSIYGVVADKATGEPIKSAGVELSPGGLKTITGSEGQFEFVNQTPGSYTLLITKTGYSDYASPAITVQANQQTKVDVQIEKLPPALKVVDDNRQEISTLDFGSAIDDVARSFSLFNDGTESLEWQITTTAEWIKSVSKIEGVLSAGATQSLIVIIDRVKLSSGKNTTTVHITSNNGSKQLTITATNSTVLATLNTLAVTNVKPTSAILNGEILTDGSPKYSERGFVYSESSMPTISDCIKKVTSPLTDDKKFSFTITGLTQGRTYFARAYVVCAGQVVYSTNEISFIPDVLSLPTFTFGGSLYYVAPDQGDADQHEAESICSELVYAYYDDWYLPDVGELMAMYSNRSSIGGFSSDTYWSSTFKFVVSFSRGTGYETNHLNTSRVRCVRREN